MTWVVPLIRIAAVAAVLFATGHAFAWQDHDGGNPPAVVVEIQENGSLLLDGQPVADEQLGQRLSALAARDPQPELHVKGGSILRNMQVWLMIESEGRFGFRNVRNIMSVRLAPKPSSPPPVVVTINKLGLVLDGQIVTREELAARLELIADQKPQPEVHIAAEPDAASASVGHVMAAAQRAGILRIGVISRN